MQAKSVSVNLFNVPTLLTVFRLGLIPFFVLFFYLPWEWGRPISASLFAIGAFTDWLDGYLARYLAQTTTFGEFLDPVVDKLMVAIALVMVVGDRHLPFIAIPALIIVGREFVISALREWMAELGQRTSVAVSMVGKFKTLIQMVALFILVMYRPTVAGWVAYTGALLLYTAAALTLWSMIMYLQSAWQELN